MNNILCDANVDSKPAETLWNYFIRYSSYTLLFLCSVIWPVCSKSIHIFLLWYEEAQVSSTIWCAENWGSTIADHHHKVDSAKSAGEHRATGGWLVHRNIPTCRLVALVCVVDKWRNWGCRWSRLLSPYCCYWNGPPTPLYLPSFRKKSSCFVPRFPHYLSSGLPPWRYLMPSLTWSWTTCSSWPCLSGGLDETASRDPFPPQPFCDSTYRNCFTKTDSFSWCVSWGHNCLPFWFWPVLSWRIT